MHAWKRRQLRRHFDDGGIIAYPTEAVFGLGCDPQNDDAIRRLLSIKRRSPKRGLIVIGSAVEQLVPYFHEQVFDEPNAVQTMLDSWPGPLTWVVPAAPWVSRSLTGTHASIAVRVTAHPLAQAICEAVGSAVVSTSANRTGAPPCHTALQIRQRLGGEVDLILGGATGGLAGATEIREFGSNRILRAKVPAA